MMRRLSVLLLLVALPAAAQAPAPSKALTEIQIDQKVEHFLRKLYAWGPAFKIKLGPLKDTGIPGLYEVPVAVTQGEQTDTGLVYTSRDGRFIFRGEVDDTTKDPFADNRARIHLESYPSKGPENAKVTVVFFSDFQCPHCAELYRILKVVEPKYPQVRFVYKDFPLPQHAWAMTASIAGRCAYMQSPDSFWKVHDAIFDRQESITPENVWDVMLAVAGQAGLQADTFRACLSSPEAKQAVEANIADGKAVKISNTPTVFVNGRSLIGGPQELLEQYINFELTPPR
jgi:protein-disulfide isomerase